jgi:hypothetical protein
VSLRQTGSSEGGSSRKTTRSSRRNWANLAKLYER